LLIVIDQFLLDFNLVSVIPFVVEVFCSKAGLFWNENILFNSSKQKTYSERICSRSFVRPIALPSDFWFVIRCFPTGALRVSRMPVPDWN